jgi:co-chaperonin GroES (HSP10)
MLKALNNYLLVDPMEKKDELINGIIVPGVANKDIRTGVILSASDSLSATYKKGAVVMYPDTAAIGQILHNGKHAAWVNSLFCFGIIVEDKEDENPVQLSVAK